MNTEVVRQIPNIAYCQDRKRLLEELLLAVRGVVAVNNRQTRAVIEGDEDITRFDLLIGLATQNPRSPTAAHSGRRVHRLWRALHAVGSSDRCLHLPPRSV